MVADRAQVLITVKAAPEPSKSYIDTVCVAGIRLDGPEPTWIRLYPVPFRHLSGDNKFAKYQVIDVDVNPSKSSDNRLESRRPVWESMKAIGDPVGQNARSAILERMVTKSMCQIESDVTANPKSQSLGLVRVTDLDPLMFERHPGWNDEQKRVMEDQLSQPDLFGEIDRSPVIEAPKLIARYRYRCESANCAGHRGRILDWELAALQYRERNRSETEMKASIERKFYQEKFKPGVRTHLFVGNFAAPTKRRHFSALGVWAPSVSSEGSQTLF